MSLKYAILGFLAGESMSGYDLKKKFDRSVRNFWPANQSQIYRTLAELNREGWVDQEVIAREDRLDMKIYHITDSGREALRRWLAEPLPATNYRDAFLIQVYFAAQLEKDALLALLRHELAGLEQARQHLLATYERYLVPSGGNESGRELFFKTLPLEYGLVSNQMAINWLASTIRRIEIGDYRPELPARLIGIENQ